jgi:hypothetical protein
MLNELRGDTYLLIEGRDGFLHLIHQNASLERAFAEGRLRPGYEVVVRSRIFEREGRTYRSLGVHEPDLGTLERVQAFYGKPLFLAQAQPGDVYCDPLLGYASGPSYERYAVLETRGTTHGAAGGAAERLRRPRSRGARSHGGRSP